MSLPVRPTFVLMFHLELGTNRWSGSTFVMVRPLDEQVFCRCPSFHPPFLWWMPIQVRRHGWEAQDAAPECLSTGGGEEEKLGHPQNTCQRKGQTITNGRIGGLCPTSSNTSPLTHLYNKTQAVTSVKAVLMTGVYHIL